jgi:NAD(P)-dependent dehydrogenase (short-subunit alcohol dehydrogenase family)
MAAAAHGALRGRRALVTGAASGIGAAVASRFGEEGARVFLADLDRDGVEAHAAGLRERGIEAWPRSLDVTDDRAVRQAVAGAREAMRGLDTVVACAGVLVRRELADTTAEELERVLRVNLLGTHNVFRHALAAVREAGDGVLLATASLASDHGSAGLGAYAASKFALIGLTQTLAQEEARHGVRVCSVAPGFVRTDMIGSFGPAVLESELAERVALGRIATPEEIADAFVMLASPLARYVTGANLAVDGGYLR